jgi:type I restriction enzyme S subunit
MRISSITVHEVVGSLRFDAKFHLSRQNPLLQQLNSGRWQMRTIGETFGKENVWSGNIFARVYASGSHHGKPLLVPYDIFRYVPWSDKILSRSQVKQFERLEIKRGWLFLVCSGRNLGPVSIADAFCEQFTMSHDMVRIAVEPSDDLFFVAAFLSTAHGQAAIRTDMNGSVIDHTDPNLVAALRYPIVNSALSQRVSKLFRTGFEKREEARLLLADTQKGFLRMFGLDDNVGQLDQEQRRFTVTRSQFVDRIDAEPRAPLYAGLRSRILQAGGCFLSDIAEIFKPASRYKTNYVDDQAFGVAMMNGRQISQYRAIALRWMSLSAFSDPEQFLLKSGATLLTADGRAEENLADCVFVTEDRAGWAASGHVHRVTPRNGINPGLVYLACSCALVQAQLKALATGSVVDALSTADVASVVVPYKVSAEANKLGNDAQRAWELFAAASTAENAAIEALEAEFKGN